MEQKKAGTSLVHKHEEALGSLLHAADVTHIPATHWFVDSYLEASKEFSILAITTLEPEVTIWRQEGGATEEWGMDLTHRP